MWTVMFDVRDSGGHLDDTDRGWAASLAARVRLVVSRLKLVAALPLDFHFRCGVVRAMFIAGALHGAFSQGSLEDPGGYREVAPQGGAECGHPGGSGHGGYRESREKVAPI